MKQTNGLSQKSIYDALGGHRLPRWEELPNLELYMDQVLALIDRYLGTYPGFDSKKLTASMVNNYVKQELIPAPVKKRYTREHVARLVMICVLKNVLPISAIQELISAALNHQSTEILYDGFCALFEQTGKAVAASSAELPEDTAMTAIMSAALRSQAEQALALRLTEGLKTEKADAKPEPAEKKTAGKK